MYNPLTKLLKHAEKLLKSVFSMFFCGFSTTFEVCFLYEFTIFFVQKERNMLHENDMYPIKIYLSLSF